MASEVGAKSAHTGCCTCFRHWQPKKDKVNDLAKSTPLPPSRSERGYTPKEVQDFSKLVKADQVDEGYAHSADESISEEEVKTVEVVFKKIRPQKGEKKDE